MSVRLITDDQIEPVPLKTLSKHYCHTSKNISHSRPQSVRPSQKPPTRRRRFEPPAPFPARKGWKAPYDTRQERPLVTLQTTSKVKTGMRRDSHSTGHRTCRLRCWRAIFQRIINYSLACLLWDVLFFCGGSSSIRPSSCVSKNRQ